MLIHSLLLERCRAAAVACLLAAAPCAAQSPPPASLLAHEADITKLISQMTLAEKVGMIHASSPFTSGGVPRLGIPEIITTDGPHGISLEHGRSWDVLAGARDSATYLPTGVCLAATWNPKLGYDFGAVLGQEARARGKDVLLGPGINIIRTPLNGRNFEYLSEDPYLIARLAVGYIRGVQAQGVAACVKHFAANNQETHRKTVSVQLSERALREIYLPGFEAAVQQGGARCVMGAYNKVRGQWASHNDYLLNGILKGEWQFKGAVISDWDAVHDTRQALANGLDLEMGTDLGMGKNISYDKFYLGPDALLPLIQSGEVLATALDDKVRRLLRVQFATGLLPAGTARPAGSLNTPAHQATARKVAEEGIVLLKNTGGLLPLTQARLKTVAVIGENATRPNALGGGSSKVKALYEITPLSGLQTALGPAVRVTYAPGYRIARGQNADAQFIAEAVAAAKAADVAIVVGGWTHGFDYSKWSGKAYDAEDVDKRDLDMPFGQNELIRAVLKANPRTVVVLLGGGPLDISGWVGQAPALVQAWYPGMEGGTALARVLLGTVNPSGKLPMTFPVHLADAPAHKLGQFPYASRQDSLTVNYLDDIFVGYRYFDTYQVAPQFAFGHGLSYTSFGYDKMVVTPDPAKHQATVRLTLTNTGRVAGAEVVQLYVQPAKGAVPRPAQELKGFEKVFLRPGEVRQVTLQLAARDFQYYDEGRKQWVLAPGRFQLLLGSSSRDIRLRGAVVL